MQKQVPTKKRISKLELAKYDTTPLYFYTEKDSLNRVTVLKETGKEIYLVAGRYSKFENDSRLYTPLTDEEKGEVEKQLWTCRIFRAETPCIYFSFQKGPRQPGAVLEGSENDGWRSSMRSIMRMGHATSCSRLTVQRSWRGSTCRTMRPGPRSFFLTDLNMSCRAS